MNAGHPNPNNQHSTAGIVAVAAAEADDSNPLYKEPQQCSDERSREHLSSSSSWVVPRHVTLPSSIDSLPRMLTIFEISPSSEHPLLERFPEPLERPGQVA